MMGFNLSSRTRVLFWLAIVIVVVLSGFISLFEYIAAYLLVYALPIGLAISLHEAAHAFAASFLGDEKPKEDGRCSIDPLAHFDLVGMICLPSLMIFLGMPGIGYAKPVVITNGKLRGWRLCAFSLAGPAANLLMTIFWLAIKYFAHGSTNEVLSIASSVAQVGIITNAMLLLFNLLPIPPLDGGKAVISFLPKRIADKALEYELFGFCFVIGMANAGWLLGFFSIIDKLIAFVLTI